MKFFVELSVPQMIWVILGPIIILSIIFLLIYLPLRSRYNKKNYQDLYYKRIRDIADNEDYYLLNNFIFKIEGAKTAKIDHLLVGEKYFYLITGLYYDGHLSGKEFDSSLILTNGVSGKQYTDNPLFQTKLLLNRLSMATGLDTSLMIGIVVVNDTCEIKIIHEKRPDGSEIPADEKIYYICNSKKLKSLIKKIESRNVEKINPSQLDRAIKGLDKLNRRKR